MAIDVWVMSVGAVLVILLLMALIFTSGQKDKPAQDHMNQRNSGIYLHVVLIWLGWLCN